LYRLLAQIDLARIYERVNSGKDLVEGTLFKISMIDYLNGEGMNENTTRTLLFPNLHIKTP
jgi:hypothetical protein